jgi:hypothetical protein
MRSGETADNAAATRTTHIIGIRLTKKPVVRFIKTAMTSAGRMRSDAPSAETPCTSWKLWISATMGAESIGTGCHLTYNKLLYSSILLQTALIMRIMMQTLVNAGLRQRALGTRAGLLILTRRLIHQAKAGAVAALRINKTIWFGFRMLWISDDSMLVMSDKCSN